MGAKELDVVITVIAVILVIMLWIMLYDSNRFVVRHYPLRDQRIKKSVKAVVLADLHNKRYGKENERLLQAIDEIGPDMILIAGDMLTAKHWMWRWDFLRSLQRSILSITATATMNTA